jgi:hypothetical protein
MIMRYTCILILTLLCGCGTLPIELGQVRPIGPGESVTFEAGTVPGAALEVAFDIALPAFDDVPAIQAVRASNLAGTGWLVIGTTPSGIVTNAPGM